MPRRGCCCPFHLLERLIPAVSISYSFRHALRFLGARRRRDVAATTTTRRERHDGAGLSLWNVPALASLLGCCDSPTRPLSAETFGSPQQMVVYSAVPHQPRAVDTKPLPAGSGGTRLAILHIEGYHCTRSLPRTSTPLYASARETVLRGGIRTRITTMAYWQRIVSPDLRGMAGYNIPAKSQ